jgi:hypothetical protein
MSHVTAVLNDLPAIMPGDGAASAAVPALHSATGCIDATGGAGRRPLPVPPSYAPSSAIQTLLVGPSRGESFAPALPLALLSVA